MGMSSRPAGWLFDLMLLPVLWVATAWVRWRQSVMLRNGVALNREQLHLARRVGVKAPERVRLIAAASIPLPLPRKVRSAAQRAGWISPHIAGMTLGYAIVLREDYFADASLLAHELAHVAQYERLGGVRGFLRQYLRECVWPGYPRGALELEARAAEAQGSMLVTDVIPYTRAAGDESSPGQAL